MTTMLSAAPLPAVEGGLQRLRPAAITGRWSPTSGAQLRWSLLPGKWRHQSLLIGWRGPSWVVCAHRKSSISAVVQSDDMYVGFTGEQEELDLKTVNSSDEVNIGCKGFGDTLQKSSAGMEKKTTHGTAVEHGNLVKSFFATRELECDAKFPISVVHGSRISDSMVCHSAPGPFPASRRKIQSCEVTAAPRHHGYHKTKGSIVGNLKVEQGSVCAREAIEANLGEVSASREETSGAIDRQSTINGYEGALTSTLVLDREPITGGAFDFRGTTLPLSRKPLVATKKVVLVRHGLSAWNAEGRIQGSSDLSALSEEGIAQALRCKQSLTKLKFCACFASPISRAKTSAEVIWSGREESLVFLDSLKEANLLFLEGMRNVDAKEQYPELYRSWREDPVNFEVNGVFPVVNLWAQAKLAWQEILSAEGDLFLVVTHKSILRALMCTALGMGPDRFRAMDINNGGITVFTVNTRGEPLLQCLNMTAHLHVDGVYY